MRSQFHHALAIGAAGVVLSAGAVQAQTFVAGPAPRSMSLGPVSAPPTGFVDLCERTPQECLSSDGPTPERLSEVRAWAGQTRWAAIFRPAGLLNTPLATPGTPTVAPAPSSVGSSVVSRPAAAPPPPLQRAATGSLAKGSPTPAERKACQAAAGKTAGRRTAKACVKASTAKPSPETTERPALSPAPSEAESIPAPPVELATVPFEGLQTINRRINRAIRRASDAETFGREDLWVLPTGPRARGDCEDYVLAKRRALIEAGVAPNALSIAIVRTRRGETHAVLLVATTEGELVLDNLSPWVLRWDQAPYDWLERQAPGRALTWVQVAA